MLVRRILTALFLCSALGAIYWFFKETGLVALCSISAFVIAYEYSFFIRREENIQQVFFIFLSFLFYIFFAFVSHSFLAFIFCFTILSFLFLTLTQQPVEKRILKLADWLMGIVYCGGLAGVVTVGILEYGSNFFMALFLVSFGTDTFAYVGGRLAGRTKLLPAISPNKTLEGSISGLAGGSILAIVFLHYQLPASNMVVVVSSCLFASCFSQIGDLFESLMKRYSGVKDSGTILPGHGGILDRVDGLLFAAPFLYLGFQYFSL